MYRHLLQLSLLLLLVAAVPGCGTFGKKEKKGTPEEEAEKKRTYYLALLEFEKYRTEQNELGEMEYMPGKYIYVKPIPLLTSRNITHFEPYAVAGGMGLRGGLDREGTVLWTQISGTYRGDMLALFIDGKFRAFIKIPQYSTGNTFELTGPFSEHEAARIAAEAEANYGNARFKDMQKEKEKNKKQ